MAKNPDDALLLIKAAVQLEPQDTTLQLSLAQVYEDKGAYAKAIALYQGAAKGWHPYPLMLLYHRIATLYLRQNNFPEAIPWLEKSVALLSHLKYQKQRSIYIQMKRFNFSEEVRLYNDLGTAYFFHNESLRAVEAFEKAIALDPRYLESYDGLGASLMNLKDFKKASDIFQQALELDPKNENARKNLATARTALKVSGKDLALSES